MGLGPADRWYDRLSASVQSIFLCILWLGAVLLDLLLVKNPLLNVGQLYSGCLRSMRTYRSFPDGFSVKYFCIVPDGVSLCRSRYRNCRRVTDSEMVASVLLKIRPRHVGFSFCAACRHSPYCMDLFMWSFDDPEGHNIQGTGGPDTSRIFPVGFFELS